MFDICNRSLCIMLGQTIASQGKKKGLSLYLRMDTGTRCNEGKEKKFINIWEKNFS